jgi:2-amino-4-hydroxy-6-hydroxymethyldihydropteridine diphosphokinase
MGKLVFVALGSNLGNSTENVRKAMDRLEEFSTTRLLRSSLWQSTPVDCPPGSPTFINAVIGLTVTESAEELLERLQWMEKEFGREEKKVLNEARPLDLDLIAFGEEERATERLTLPHPRAHSRKFVLEPLAEIAPELVLPGQKKTVRELLATLRTDERVERV